MNQNQVEDASFDSEASQAPVCLQADQDGAGFDAFHRLCAAASTANLGQAREAIAQGAPVNGTQADGKTPAMLAAYANHAPMVLFLREHGADLNASDASGQRPLFFALKAPVQPRPSSKLDTIRTLLLMGASGDVLDGSGMPFTHHLPHHFSSEQMQDIINQGLDFGKLSPDGDGFLHIVAAHQKGPIEYTRKIIYNAVMHGALLNGKDVEGKTPMDVALYHPNAVMADALKFYGAKTAEQLAAEPDASSRSCKVR